MSKHSGIICLLIAGIAGLVLKIPPSIAQKTAASGDSADHLDIDTIQLLVLPSDDSGTFRIACALPGMGDRTPLLYRVDLADGADTLLTDDLSGEYLDRIEGTGSYRYEVRLGTCVLAQREVLIARKQSLSLLGVSDSEAYFRYRDADGKAHRFFCKLDRSLTALVMEDESATPQVISLPFKLVGARLIRWYGMRRAEISISPDLVGADGTPLTIQSYRASGEPALRAQVTLERDGALLTLTEGDALSFDSDAE